MTGPSGFTPQCPAPLADHPSVLLAHGGGGTLTRQLIERMFLPRFDNPFLAERHDGAVLQIDGARLAFTTDSYVVRPAFFPGGDIGSLAVNGTVNDLAMCGARPLYLSAGLILEEGFPMRDLQRVVDSMRLAAEQAGVSLVTGDTKVVDRGSGDGVFINTSGIGAVRGDRPVGPASVRAGDRVVVSGDLGRHGIAVMSIREGLALEEPIESDTVALAEPVMALIDSGVQVHCLRDLTRGGLATALVEIALASGLEINIDEARVPVASGVRGMCEILGFDPLYVANEGRFVAFVPPAALEPCLEILRSHPQTRLSRCIGTVREAERSGVTARTVIGGERVLDLLSGEQLPRIC